MHILLALLIEIVNPRFLILAMAIQRPLLDVLLQSLNVPGLLSLRRRMVLKVLMFIVFLWVVQVKQTCVYLLLQIVGYFN